MLYLERIRTGCARWRWLGLSVLAACLLAAACDDAADERPDSGSDTAQPDTPDDTAQPDTSPGDTADDTASDTASDTRDTASDTASDTRDTASDTAGDLGDTVADTGDASDATDSDATPAETCAPLPDDLPALDVQRFGRWDVVESFPGDAFGVLDRKVEVFLPPGYDDPANAQTHYPVLYMHDGQNLFDPAQSAFGTEWQVDETLDALVAAGTIEPWIVVALRATDARIAEYTPDADPEYGGGQGDAYLALLTRHVKPWAEARYRVRCGAEHTAIAGSSLGGLISLHAALEHPEHFGRVAALSPSLWWNDRSMVQRVTSQSFMLPSRLWLDGGSAEGTVLPTGETTVVANAREVRDRALALGGGYGREVGYLEVPGGEHNEAAWAARLPVIFEFLLGDEDFSAAAASPDAATLHVYDTWLAPQDASQTALELRFDTMRLTWPGSDVVFTADEAGVLDTATGDGRLVGQADGTVFVTASARGVSAPQQVFLEVDSDPADATVRFTVSVPAGTDAVHLTGAPAALGTWDGVGQGLSALPDGRYAGEVALPLGFFEYKYTRGSWATVEKDAAGNEIGNRAWTLEGPVVLEDAVASWAQ